MRSPVFRSDWPKDIEALYAHDVREIWDPKLAPHVWNQFHSQLDLYLGFAGAERSLDVLDVGCAQATLALLLAERGHRVTAVDIRSQFLDYARSRHEKGQIRFLTANALELDLDDHFDLIFANQILEHTVYPHALVLRLVAHLRPRGRLVAATPNWAYFANRRSRLPSYTALGNPADNEHRQFTADDDGHFFAYTRDELRVILSQSGLSEVRVSYFETPWISGHARIRHLHAFLPAWLLRFLDSSTLRLPGSQSLLAHQLLGTGVVAA